MDCICLVSVTHQGTNPINRARRIWPHVCEVRQAQHYGLFMHGLSSLTPRYVLPFSTGREDAAPTASIFPPSAEQLKGGSATAVCLVSGFYPSDAGVTWKMDGTSTSTGVLTSTVQQDAADNTYSKSSTLTIPASEYNSHNLYTCEVTHKTLKTPLVKSFKRTECTQ